jgi:hypothetical protein
MLLLGVAFATFHKKFESTRCSWGGQEKVRTSDQPKLRNYFTFRYICKFREATSNDKHRRASKNHENDRVIWASLLIVNLELRL